MEVQFLNRDENVVKTRATGVISREHQPADGEPLARACGPNAYREKILMELREVELIDSTGVEWLLGCHERCQTQGGMLVLHTLHPLTEDFLKLMRMDLVLHVATGEEHARRLAKNSINHSDEEAANE